MDLFCVHQAACLLWNTSCPRDATLRLLTDRVYVRRVLAVKVRSLYNFSPNFVIL